MRNKVRLLILLLGCLSAAWAIKNNRESVEKIAGVTALGDRAHDLSGGAEQTPPMQFDLAAIKRPMPRNVSGNGLFESKSWYVPTPEPLYIPPPQPTAPPLEFKYIGRMVDGNEVTLFLSKNDRQYAVKEEDVVDGIYRIDKIGEVEALLTYLPTNTQQTFLYISALAGNRNILVPEGAICLGLLHNNQTKSTEAWHSRIIT